MNTISIFENVTEQQISSWNNYVNGNNHALGELYACIFEKLVFRAIYYTKNQDIAWDIVGELFVYLLEIPNSERINRWNTIENAEALLLAIVRNKCLDYLKISANRLRILENQSENDFIDEQDKNDLIQQLEQCLKDLNEADRKIIQMHFKGFSNHEIGENFNMNEKTIRNKLSLSRKRIIKLWNQMSIFIHFLWS